MTTRAADRPLRKQAVQSGTALLCCCERYRRKDRTTVLYLQDCAQQAGEETRFIYIEKNWGFGVGGVLTDLDDNVIRRAFKLYPLGG